MTDMSKQTEALKLALEALEEIHPGNMTPIAEEAWKKAITAMREALAQQTTQQQEPVSDRENAIIRFALHQFMSNAYSNMKAAAQDKDSRHYTVGAVEKFAKDAKDAEALLSRLQFKAPQPAQQQEPVAHTKAIAECLAVLRQLVKGKWPHEQALEELAGYTSPPASKPLTDEQHSLAYWQHEINKARDEAYLQGFAAGKKEAKCSAG